MNKNTKNKKVNKVKKASIPPNTSLLKMKAELKKNQMRKKKFTKIKKKNKTIMDSDLTFHHSTLATYTSNSTHSWTWTTTSWILFSTTSIKTNLCYQKTKPLKTNWNKISKTCSKFQLLIQLELKRNVKFSTRICSWSTTDTWLFIIKFKTLRFSKKISENVLCWVIRKAELMPFSNSMEKNATFLLNIKMKTVSQATVCLVIVNLVTSLSLKKTCTIVFRD